MISEYLIILVLLFILLIIERGVWRLWQKNKMADANLALSSERLIQLEERKGMLEIKISKLGTARGVEEEIRTNFSVVKPGEKVVSIVEEEKATTTTVKVEKRSWWQIF